MPLTARQRLFIEEYCVDRNGAQAAIRAGYASEGANATAARLLAKASIRRAVDKELARQAKRIQVTAERVLTEYACLAFAQHNKAFGPDGKLLPMREWPEDLRRCVASFDVDTRVGDDGQEVQRMAKVRFWPKGAALEALGKHLNLFVEKLELGTEGGPVTISINRTVKPGGDK